MSKSRTASTLAEGIAGVELAVGAEKADVGPVEGAEVNTHEWGRGRTAGCTRCACPSRGYRWHQVCWGGLREPPPQNPRRWNLGNMEGQGAVRPEADSRGCRKTSAYWSRRVRHCHENASASGPERGQNLN